MSPIRSTSPVTAADNFVPVPVKSLNLREELPELMTSTDAIKLDHVGCRKYDVVESTLMLIDHTGQSSHGTFQSIYGRPTLRLHPIPPVQSDEYQQSDDRLVLNLGPLSKLSTGLPDHFCITSSTWTCNARPEQHN